VPDSCAFQFELFTEKTKIHKSPGINQIPAELIKAGSRIIRAEIQLLFFSIRDKEELPEDGKSRSLYLSMRKTIKQILVIIGACRFCRQCSKCYSTNCCQS
jgi:hypothetical protein